jgi:alpha-beta hydrolase superfamily lysophospholipase
MKVEEYRWKSSRSVQLYGKVWIPDTPMRAFVVMIHGIGEHSGCYKRWAEKFAAESIGFLAFDLRGHGRSTGKRGHASIAGIKSDIKTVLHDVFQKVPAIPVVLYGHSMGGNIVLNYAMGKHVKVQGIIASSPWLKLVKPPSEFLVRLAKVAAHLMPSMTLSTGIKADHLGGTAEKSAKTDPLMHKRISVKLFADLWESGETILRSKHRVNVPLLLMHGNADKLVSCQASRSFVHNTGEKTKFKQWNGMYHDLHNDAASEAVFQYVLKWISGLEIKNGKVQNNSKIYRVA